MGSGASKRSRKMSDPTQEELQRLRCSDVLVLLCTRCLTFHRTTCTCQSANNIVKRVRYFVIVWICSTRKQPYKSQRWCLCYGSVNATVGSPEQASSSGHVRGGIVQYVCM